MRLWNARTKRIRYQRGDSFRLPLDRARRELPSIPRKGEAVQLLQLVVSRFFLGEDATHFGLSDATTPLLVECDYAIAFILGVPMKAMGMVKAPVAGKGTGPPRLNPPHGFGVRDDINLWTPAREVLPGVNV